MNLSCKVTVESFQGSFIVDKQRLFMQTVSIMHSELVISIYAILGETLCYSCRKPLFVQPTTASLSTDKAVVFLFLCQHALHASCAFPSPDVLLPSRPEHVTSAESNFSLYEEPFVDIDKQFRSRLRFVADLRSRVRVRCPVCEGKGNID